MSDVAPSPPNNSEKRNGKDAVLIANPVAGGGLRDRADRAIRRLRDGGLSVDLRLTQAPDHGIELAREAVSEGASLVIALGGDGAINEVIDGVVGSPADFAMIPAGTLNVSALELNIPFQIEAACDMILSGRVQPVPVGRLEWSMAPDAENAGEERSRHFLMMAGVGFDAEAVRRVNLRVKKTIGRLAYGLSGLSAWMSYPAPPICCHFEDGVRAAGYAAIVSNIRSYAGAHRIAPDGKLEQPFFNVCLFRRASRLSVLRYALAVTRGKHIELPDVIYRPARVIEMRSRGLRAPIQLDGDYIARLPARIEIVPDALRLCLPGQSTD